MRRHVGRLDLGAWFDGEQPPLVAEEIACHLAACARCRRRVADLRRVRAALRDEAAPALPRSSRISRRWPAVAAIVAIFVLAATAPVVREAPQRGDRLALSSREQSRSPGAATDDGTTAVAAVEEPSPAAKGTEREVAPGGGPAAAPPGARAPQARPAAGSTAPQEAAPGAAALRLGVVVPDVEAPIALGMADAVRRAADAANRAGGVGGQPVTVTVLVPRDVTAGSGEVDVLVGGFGAPPPAEVPWIFPADPTVVGPTVVPAEVSPAEAGRVLGRDVSPPAASRVGVIVGDGPEEAFADGLASEVPTVAVEAGPATSCRDEVIELRRAGVAAVAVAGGADLVERCAEAAARLAWVPPRGFIVPPSAAYRAAAPRPHLWGARTVLGLPWPSSDHAGAQRFRAAVGHGRSYEALVSFAAAELAVEAARRGNGISAGALLGESWRSDLYHIEAAKNAAAALVVADPSGWRRGEGRADRE